MSDKYICMKCKGAGDKIFAPYKIIKDNGEGIKFIGQLCEECFKQLTAPAPAPSTSEKNEENKDKEEDKN